MRLSDRFIEAVQYANRVHGGDSRKGTTIPYLSHLLSVCGLVLADGGDEEEAIAALLHDMLEDHPELTSRAEIRARFGDRVLTLVEACTDTPPEYAGGEKAPWRKRKEAYVTRVRTSAATDLRVSLADKLDNARAILADLRVLGEEVFSRFNAGKDDQLWYYRALVDAYRAAGASSMLLREFTTTVSEIERLTSGEPAA